MLMRDYEDMKDIVIPKEQEEMMNIICEAWEECHTLKNCKECPDRQKEFMRMMMCTSLKYTRKLMEAGYTKHKTTDMQEVRHGRWINESRHMYGPISAQCSVCKLFSGTWLRNEPYKYCPHCGAKMDGKE